MPYAPLCSASNMQCQPSPRICVAQTQTMHLTTIAHRSLFHLSAASRGSQSCTCRNSSQLVSRRVLLGSVAFTSLLAIGSSAQADIQLPKAYQEFAPKLITALEESILADINGEEEREVRRKADPAKNLVREFVQQWRSAPAVQGDKSHKLITDIVQQLGQFYQTNGGRARLPENLGRQLLSQLQEAKDALPTIPSDTRLLPFPF